MIYIGRCPWVSRDYVFGLPPDALADVNKTLKYMINNRFPSGNYPRDEAKRSDELVYWCHGAPGVALTLVKAAEVSLFKYLHGLQSWNVIYC